MKINTPMHTIESGIAAWRFIILSITLVVIFGFIYSINIITECYLFARLNALIHDTLANKTSIAVVSGNDTFKYYADKHYARLKDLIAVISSVENEDFEASVTVVRSRLVTASPIFRTDIDNCLEQLSNSSANIKTKNIIISGISKDLVALANKYLEIKNEAFSELGLSSRDNRKAEDFTKTDFSFYDQSYLQSLPVLEGLEDGISTETDLNNALGVKPVSTEQASDVEQVTLEPQDDMRKKFEKIRTESFELRQKLESLFQRKEQADSDFFVASQEHSEQKAHALEILYKEILDRTRPDYPPQAFEFYNKVVNKLLSAGITLPELDSNKRDV